MKNNNPDKKTDEITHKPDSSLPILKIDYALYQHYLDDFDLSETDKQEFLDTLWLMIVSFVDLGFGVHPVQQVCGEKLSLDEFLLSESAPMLKENKQSNNKMKNENHKQNSLEQERSQQ